MPYECRVRTRGAIPVALAPSFSLSTPAISVPIAAPLALALALDSAPYFVVPLWVCCLSWAIRGAVVDVEGVFLDLSAHSAHRTLLRLVIVAPTQDLVEHVAAALGIFIVVHRGAPPQFPAPS